MKLRPYQQDSHDAVFKEWEDVVSTLVVAPTGTGKTVLFAAIINTLQPKRAMVVAHREELIWQAREKIEAFTGLHCEIEMADLQAENSLFHSSPVVISTVQTQNSSMGMRKRMSRFDPMDFGALIIDECHRGTADTYQNLINYYRKNPDLRILGVTATPDRQDEQALGQIFDSVAHDYEILDAIHDGWLVPIEQQFVHVSGLDFSRVRTVAGDLNGADLAAVMEAEANLQGVAGASMEIIGDKRTLVFTASVNQAEMLCNIFNRHRHGMAGWVCGKTNKDDRRSLLSQFSDGTTQVVVNCGVLTEGYDNPWVECIVMARPTKSRSLYAQMAGRSTRPIPGLVDGLETAEERRMAIASSKKPKCLIIDFVGNSGRHKLMSSVDILGGKVSDEACSRALARATKGGKPVAMSALLDECESEIKQEELLRRKREEELRKHKVVAKVKYTKKSVNPFDVLDIQPAVSRGWDQGKQLSLKQRAVLSKQGINPDEFGYAASRQLINEMFRRWKGNECTFGQAKVLKRYDLPTNVTKEQASAWLDSLAKNGWRKPSNMGEIVPESNIPF